MKLSLSSYGKSANCTSPEAIIHLWCFNLDWTFILCCDLLGMKQGSLNEGKRRMFYSLAVG